MSSIKFITIEAGHGKPSLWGYDKGCSGTLNGQKYYERDLAVDLVHVITQKLAGKVDCGVFYVGVDSRATLPKKTAYVNSLAQKFGRGIGLAIHFNSSGTGKAQGTEIYYQTQGKKDFAKTMEASFANYQVFPLRKPCIKPSSADRFGKLYIDDWNVEAILVEPCFLDNAEDLNTLLYQIDKVAECIAQGIIEYFKIN